MVSAWTRNPVVPGSSPALATCCIFVLGHPEFKSPAMLINSQLVASCQLRFLIHAVMLYLNLLVSKYLSGVPVN